MVLDKPIGVPQGTVAGPLFWLAFADSLQMPIGSTVKYADDTTGYVTIQKHSTDHSALQQMVDGAQSWSHENGMALNAGKTQIMTITLSKDVTIPSIRIGSHLVEQTKEAKFLGVTVDEHLRFDSHIANITRRARQRCYGLLLLSKRGVERSALLRLFKATVLPVLTYAAASWYPYATERGKAKLEGVQKTGLRIVFGTDTSYSEHLCQAGLQTVATQLDSICIKYVEACADDHNHMMFNRLPPRQSTRGRHSIRLRDNLVKKARTVTRSKSLFLKFSV